MTRQVSSAGQNAGHRGGAGLRQPAQAGRLGRETGSCSPGGSRRAACLGGVQSASCPGGIPGDSGPADGTGPDGLVPGMILILNFGEGGTAVGQREAVMRDAVLPAKAARGGYRYAEQPGEPGTRRRIHYPTVGRAG